MFTRYFKRAIAVAVAFIGLSPALSLAEHPSREMLIGSLHAPPYIMQTKNGQVQGIIAEAVREALAPLGIKPVFLISSWPRAFRNAQQGKVDALIPAIKSPDREQYLIYPDEPLTTFRMVLLKNTLNHDDVEALDQIHGLPVGRIRNARVSPDFDVAADLGFFELEERSDFNELAKGVAFNRIAYAAGPELMLLWGAAETHVLDKVEASPKALRSVPVYMPLTKTSKFAAHIDEISARVMAARNSPAVQKALQEYGRYLKTQLNDKY